jgi:7-cyano-7-deazaguanine synthase
VDQVAVLASGGLDSSIMLAELKQTREVFPIYIRNGLAWESAELRALESFISALESPSINTPTIISTATHELYGNHWSVTGLEVPVAGTPDSAVFLPGRNILLIGLVAIWCTTHDIPQIAIGSLDGNPFPDATPIFFKEYGRLLSTALRHKVEILTPYRFKSKAQLISKCSHLPLNLTMTCISPYQDNHCGQCSKCHERQQAFTVANVVDPTTYIVTERGASG